MQLYDLPIWAGDSARFPSDGFRGVGWRLLAAEVPYSKHGTKAWERHFCEMRKKYPQYSVHYISHGDEIWIAPQIIAEAKSRLRAQKVFHLLTSSISVLDGSNTFEWNDGVVVPRNRRQLEDLSAQDLEGPGHTISRDNVILGCRLAAALSKRKSFMYAAYKLTLNHASPTTLRRVTGIHLLQDTYAFPLPELAGGSCAHEVPVPLPLAS